MANYLHRLFINCWVSLDTRGVKLMDKRYRANLYDRWNAFTAGVTFAMAVILYPTQSWIFTTFLIVICITNLIGAWLDKIVYCWNKAMKKNEAENELK